MQDHFGVTTVPLEHIKAFLHSLSELKSFGLDSGESLFYATGRLSSLFYSKDAFEYFMGTNPDIFVMFTDMIDLLKDSSQLYFDEEKGQFIKNLSSSSGEISAILEPVDIALSAFGGESLSELANDANQNSIPISDEELIQMYRSFKALPSVEKYQQEKYGLVLR